MPTLLTTRRMSPELAARVEASIRGRRAGSGARLAPRSLSLLRIGAVLTAVGALSWLVALRQRGHEQLAHERAALLERQRREAASLSDAEKAIATKVSAWLERSSAEPDADFVAGELGGVEALASTVLRPTLYVRGPLAAFKNSKGIEASAASSAKDAFVLCLMAPPPSKTEKALLAKVRSAYAGGDRLHEPTAHVQRLYHALVGLPFLAAGWQARVLAAEEQRDLDRLRRAFERAPLRAAKLAAKASLLLFAMDEPGDGSGPSELDGERAHWVRVGLVDLAADRLLLRLRRRVDPSWLSAGVRAEYASGMDGCSLALEVHERIRARKEPVR